MAHRQPVASSSRAGNAAGSNASGSKSHENPPETNQPDLSGDGLGDTRMGRSDDDWSSYRVKPSDGQDVIDDAKLWRFRSPPPPPSIPSSSKSQSFGAAARLLSPPVAAATLVESSKLAKEDEHLRVFKLVDQRNSVSEFVDLVPEPYKGVAGALLKQIRNTLDSIISSEATLTRYKASRNLKEVITELRGHRVPVIQTHSAFALGKDYQKALDATHQKYIDEMTLQMIAAKEHECQALGQKILPEAFVVTIQEALQPIFDLQKKTESTITFKDKMVTRDDGETVKELEPVTVQRQTTAREEFRLALNVLSASFTRMINRETDRHAAKADIAKQKKELKEKASVDAGHKPTVDKAELAKAVDARLKALGIEPKPSPKTTPSKKPSASRKTTAMKQDKGKGKEKAPGQGPSKGQDKGKGKAPLTHPSLPARPPSPAYEGLGKTRKGAPASSAKESPVQKKHKQKRAGGGGH